MRQALHTVLTLTAIMFAILAIVVASMLFATARPGVEPLIALFIPAVVFGVFAWAIRKKPSNLKGKQNA